jgi:hypothetical protein
MSTPKREPDKKKERKKERKEEEEEWSFCFSSKNKL